MFKFPEQVYTDVRIEDVYETRVVYSLGTLEESRVRNYKAAFIRVFDGQRWYYSSTSDIQGIQQEIAALVSYAAPNGEIYDNPIVQKFEVNKAKLLRYETNDVSKVSLQNKQELLKEYFPILQGNQLIKNWKAYYVDKRVIKEFYSSKGAALTFDTQFVGISIAMNFSEGEKRLSERHQVVGDAFEKTANKLDECKALLAKCEGFLKTSVPVKPGKYTAILSPLATGVFAHESFGHKSESDFMIGDEAMKKEWSIGRKVASDILSIVDSGSASEFGYTPFDDEGTKATETYLVKSGILSSRLHSSTTAASLEEALTGNARSINFEYEPIVRMTCTYIMPGDKTKEQLISEVKEGIYIDTVKHGSGMSTFTIAPSLAYYIRDGKLAEPVSISVLTGNVMDTLNEIDGLSDTLELYASVLGGCGKGGQYPLSVGMGGPYVRVRNLNVQ